jgi:hypothetical protein
MPGWPNPNRSRGHTGTYEVRLRGQGLDRFSFRDGILTMNRQERGDPMSSSRPNR